MVLPLVPVTSATARPVVRCSRSRGSILSPQRPPATVPCPRPRRREAALTTRVVSDSQPRPHEGGFVRASSSAVGAGRVVDSSGNRAAIAAMIVAVSASASVNGSESGSPTRTVTVGGRNTKVTSGVRADRGHTLSVPQIPMGMTGAPVEAARRAVPVLPLQLGVEERRATGDGPLRQHQHDLARPQGRVGGAQRLVRSATPFHGDPPQGPGDGPDHRRVEDLLLAHEPRRPAQPGDQEGECRHVEVAPMVGGQQDGATPGDVLHSADVKAGIGEPGGPHERTQHVVGLHAQQARHARWRVPVLNGPAPEGGDGRQRQVRVDGVRPTDAGQQRGVEDAVTAGVAVAQVDAFAVGPGPNRLQLARAPHEALVETPRVAAVPCLVGGGDDGVEAHGLRRRGRPCRPAWWWSAPTDGRRPGSRPDTAARRGPRAR